MILDWFKDCSLILSPAITNKSLDTSVAYCRSSNRFHKDCHRRLLGVVVCLCSASDDFPILEVMAIGDLQLNSAEVFFLPHLV